MRIAHPHRFLLISSATHHFLFIRSISIPNPTLLRRKTISGDDSMASGEEAPATLTAAEEDEKYGFRRPEMYQSNLAGTVDAYDRHLFLCYKSADDWASRVENSDAETLPKLLASALKARKKDIVVKTKLTICEEREGTEFSDGDVLIFPEMIKYRGLKDLDVDSFVQDVLVNGKPWELGLQEVLTGSYVFVCTHGSRDRRCGVCGPVLIEKFKEEIELRGLNDQVIVNGCSHVGGHKYAGNLIIYCASPDGNITGHWYGYVTPDDVSALLDQHIAKGEVIERLLRGQMGVTAEEGETANDQKLPNGFQETNKQPERVSQEIKETFIGCCQGSNGCVTSCAARSVEESGESEEKKIEACVKGGPLCKLTSWIGSFEQRDVLTAAAVVGAVATVAVAYSYFRRSH